MSTVKDEPLMDREGSANLYLESEKLLRLAEGLQDKCEQYQRRVWMLYAIGVTIILASVSIAVYLTYSALSDFLYMLWPTLAYCYAFAVGAYLYYLQARIHRQLARERRALHSIVDMLRGLEKGIAEKNNLSALERAEFRIRLSRFDIGPG